MADDPSSSSTGGSVGAPVLAIPAPRPPLKGAPWGDPIMRVDGAWTRFEIWLATTALALEVLSLSLWVCLKGFSAPTSAGVVFRAIFGGTVLGLLSYFAFAKKEEKVRSALTVAGVFLGFATAKAWAGFGVDYSSNLLNWYQQACFLTLLGGLRGVATRLTMLLALVGGSLATGRGRHIVIDIMTRFVNHRTRKAMVLTGWMSAGCVCWMAAWGFFDHISIENFGARAEDSAVEKAGRIAEKLEEDFFIARKQIALDFRTTPHVLKGETYSEWLTPAEWNGWVDTAGFPERYGKPAADALHLAGGDTRAPIVVIPGRGEPRGDLIHAAFLVFPIGLLIIGLRFMVRCVLVVSGHVSVEVDESEDWAEKPQAPEDAVASPR